jgi:hypothetical protein
MSYRSVEPGRGAAWIGEAFTLVVRNPGVFAVMALIMAIGQATPVLNLAMIVIGPALFGGFVYAMREQDSGRPAELAHLFLAFQTPGKLRPMLMLCLPGVAVVVAIGLVAFFYLGSVFLGFAASGNQPESAAWATGLGVGAILGVLLVLAMMLALYALMFFAVPRVMLDSLEPGPALRESLAATRANLGAVLLFGVLFWLLCIVGFMLLSVIPVLGWLLWGLAATALVAAAVYRAYKDVFGPVDAAPAVPQTG